MHKIATFRACLYRAADYRLRMVSTLPHAMSRRLVTALCVASFLPGIGYAAGGIGNPGAGLDLGGIEDMTTLPTKDLKVISSDRGLIAVTSNGRWVIRGKIYDTWQMSSLDSISQVREAANHINLDGLKIDIDELDPLVFGSAGKPLVVAFVDPLCDGCASVIQQMQALTDEYVFKILPLGVQSKRSASLVKTVGCATDPQAAIKALSVHDYSGLKPKADCDLSTLRHTLITAQVFGVNSLPFLIAPDGFVRQSAPDNLSTWLADHLK